MAFSSYLKPSQGVSAMLKPSRSVSESTSFRPGSESMEDRLVPSGGVVPKAEVASPPMVGLSLENRLGRELAVVVRDLGPQVDSLVRLRRTVELPSPATNISINFTKI